MTSAFQCLFADKVFLFVIFVSAIVLGGIIFFSDWFPIAFAVFIAADFFLWLTFGESFLILIFFPFSIFIIHDFLICDCF